MSLLHYHYPEDAIQHSHRLTMHSLLKGLLILQRFVQDVCISYNLCDKSDPFALDTLNHSDRLVKRKEKRLDVLE